MALDIILDSNVWIAFLNKDDSQNAKASELFTKISIEKVLLTEYIILEVATIIKQKRGQEFANRFLLNFTNGTQLKILYSAEFYQQTIKLFISSSQNKLSFVDTSLVVLSDKYKIISFDKELAEIIASRNNQSF